LGNATLFEAEFQVAWGDLDYNRHVGNSRYLDYAVQARFLYLSSKRFAPDAFARHGIGPAILTDEVKYLKELRLLDRFKVSFEVAGRNASGSRFIIVNRFVGSDGELRAEVRSMGVWFDLAGRKAVPPPAALAAAMEAADRTADYANL
jgi:acyl-CoA thioester hydrolase